MLERSARVVTARETYWSARIVVDGDLDTDALARLDTALGLVLHARATRVTVDLSRTRGGDTAVLELLARACRELWERRGSMHVIGLRHRSIDGPQMSTHHPETLGPADLPDLDARSG